MDNPEKLATQVTQDKAKTKGKKPTTICVGHHYPQANRNNVNKTTGGRDEPNIVCMRKSQQGTHILKTHKRRTQKTKKMSNTDLNDW